MSELTDVDDMFARARETSDLLAHSIGAWQEFGYKVPPTPDCKTIPPLGDRNADAIRHVHLAVEAIDSLTRQLHALREKLVDEQREDQDKRLARTDAMLAEHKRHCTAAANESHYTAPPQMNKGDRVREIFGTGHREGTVVSHDPSTGIAVIDFGIDGETESVLAGHLQALDPEIISLPVARLLRQSFFIGNPDCSQDDWRIYLGHLGRREVEAYGDLTDDGDGVNG